jgi:hypothetical protein
MQNTKFMFCGCQDNQVKYCEMGETRGTHAIKEIAYRVLLQILKEGDKTE